MNIWKKKWMEIFYYIAKVKIIAKRTVIFFRPDLLNKLQLKLINDHSSNYVNIQLQNKNINTISKDIKT